MSRIDAIKAYHRRTKHLPQRYAPGPGHLDWATQPDPFRVYEGAERIQLPFSADLLETSFSRIKAPGEVPPRTLDLDAIALLLELSLALSAWKSGGGSRWALRCNPSSGNLHPAEGYVVCPDLPGIAPGVYHYVSRDHVLEHRAQPEKGRWEELWRGLPGGLRGGLSSIHWREAWKYGERAYRYCQLDAGHAVACVRYAAAALGWGCWLLPGWSDRGVEDLLGLPREDSAQGPEPEAPDLVLWVGPDQSDPGEERVMEALEGAAWSGTPNRLSSSRRSWQAIHQVEAASRRETAGSDSARWVAPDLPVLAGGHDPGVLRTATLIRERRSAVSFDGRTSLSMEAFTRILDATLPRPLCPPMDAMPWRPQVHLLLFVHRVEGLTPGVYLLVRWADDEAELRVSMAETLDWSRVEDMPPHIRLYGLQTGDCRELAAALSCGQAIAGDSAFSLGMLTRFEETLALAPWWYRRLYWEAGAIGQVLYLEAEAAGVRGTGIGCFFDDLVHRMVGIEDERFQSLYHFTVGGPQDDLRLLTHPPYEHLDR